MALLYGFDAQAGSFLRADATGEAGSCLQRRDSSFSNVVASCASEESGFTALRTEYPVGFTRNALELFKFNFKLKHRMKLDNLENM
eukprot:scaffold295_cov97-Alexandrium_tamarense.AAC.4